MARPKSKSPTFRESSHPDRLLMAKYGRDVISDDFQHALEWTHEVMRSGQSIAEKAALLDTLVDLFSNGRDSFFTSLSFLAKLRIMEGKWLRLGQARSIKLLSEWQEDLSTLSEVVESKSLIAKRPPGKASGLRILPEPNPKQQYPYHFALLWDHFSLSGRQLTHLTLEELAQCIGDRFDLWPDIGHLRRVCREVNYVWKPDKRGPRP